MSCECWKGWVRRPAYADATPVAAGDRIRYRQAPGGILPRSEAWTYGVAAPAPGDGEMCLEQDGRFYNLFGHEIERLPDDQGTEDPETYASSQEMFAARRAEVRAILSVSALEPGSRDSARREVRS